MYPFNTLQICCRHIVDVHEEFTCRKIFLTNLQPFKVSQFFTTVHVESIDYCGNSAYLVKSAPPTAFSIFS